MAASKSKTASSKKTTTKQKKPTSKKTTAAKAESKAGKSKSSTTAASSKPKETLSLKKKTAKQSTKPAGKAKLMAKDTDESLQRTATAISNEQRHQLIATAAYLRAEQRGFSGGDPMEDWLKAEQEVDAELTTTKQSQ